MKTLEDFREEFGRKGQLMSEKLAEADEMASDSKINFSTLLDKLIESHKALTEMIIAGKMSLEILAQKKQM